MVFSSVMKLHPSIEHPLIESCLTGLEKNIEKERHPQTLFLLLSYYKLKAQALQSDGYTSDQLLNNRKILRLVKHTLGHVTNVRDHEMTLLDEMLATCARETSNKSLELIFSSQLFYENRQEKFINSLADQERIGVDSVKSIKVDKSLGPDGIYLRVDQHGFVQGRSCLTNLIEFFEEAMKVINEAGAVDAVYLDFGEPFDQVPHDKLIQRLRCMASM
eukprot:g29197.t1